MNFYRFIQIYILVILHLFALITYKLIQIVKHAHFYLFNHINHSNVVSVSAQPQFANFINFLSWLFYL